MVTEGPVPEERRLFFLDSEKKKTDIFIGELNFDRMNEIEMKNVTIYIEVNCMVQKAKNPYPLYTTETCRLCVIFLLSMSQVDRNTHKQLPQLLLTTHPQH